MKYKCKFIHLVAFLIIGIILPTSSAAYNVYGGTKSIKVGESIQLETEPSTYYTVSGSWSIEGNTCVFTSRSNRSCTISGVRAGEATVRWTGVIGSADYDYVWYINVLPGDNAGGDDNGGNSSDDGGSTPKYESAWADSYDISWYNKNKDIFLISTNQELAGVAYLVNNGYTTFKGKTIKLGNNIDLSGKYWTTIGLNSSKPFEGSFDGQDHTISGIYITQQEPKQNTFGFFGVCGGNSVNNTTFKGEIDVKNPDFDDNTGEWAIGGVAGKLYSKTSIDKCVSAIQINFSITKSNSEVHVGGICGSAGANCNIRRCSHIGDICVVDEQKLLSSNASMLITIGGILGEGINNCTIDRCENISSEISCYASEHDTPGGWKWNLPIGIGGISGEECKVSYCRNIINKICLANESTTGNELSVYIGGVLGGITSSPIVTNCYSTINTVELGRSKLWLSRGGSVLYGGITANSRNLSSSKANFSNSDYSIDLPSWVTIDTQSGYNGDNSLSNEQMKTNNFLNKLNTYSIIEEGIGIWTSDENGYPCIDEIHPLIKDATPIPNVKVLTNSDVPIYNLNGQRLDKPRKGINIINGKKVIVK